MSLSNSITSDLSNSLSIASLSISIYLSNSLK